MLGEPDRPPNERTVTIQSRYGKVTFLAGDSVIGRSLQLYGEWAQNEIALLSLFIEKGAVVVDAGANIGTHSLAFASCTGPAGRVLAYEPQPELYGLLCRNLRDNSIECVEAHCAGLSDRRQVLYIPRPELKEDGNFGAVQLLVVPLLDEESFAVEAAPLDDLHLDRCDLIKADVEGMELRILKGAASTLRRCRPVLHLECNTVSRAIDIFEYLRDQPYHQYIHKTPAFNPANFFGSEERLYGTACETSILAVPLQRDPEYAARFRSNGHLMPVENVEDVATLLDETQRIADLQKLAAERGVEIGKLAGGLAEAQRLVSERDKELRRYVEALQHAEALVIERDVEIKKLSRGLAEAQGLVAERDKELKRYVDALRHAEAGVVERNKGWHR